MVELPVGARVSVRLPNGTRQADVQQVRAGFYLCRFDDGSSGWVDVRDVILSEAPPPVQPTVEHAGFVSAAYQPPAPEQSVSRPPPSLAGHAGYSCVSCGRPGADHFPPGAAPLHRACAGLGPDMLPWPWLIYAYGIVVPFGCTLFGALVATIPYYVWRKDYPLRAKAFNRHVWFGFAGSVLFWGLIGLLRTIALAGAGAGVE
jgi:hypothetical protein